MLKEKVFSRLAHVAPAVVFYVLIPLAFPENPGLVSLFRNAAFLYMIIIILLVIDSLLNAFHEIYETFDIAREIHIKGFIQAAKIIVYFVGGVLFLSVFTSRSPLFFLSGLGALTAVLMLIFKDTILGLVAGIQLTANNMVRKGDWISMPQFGADGDVLDVALTTVKVQNWDKTITTIPTYALISQCFKNWRGMKESGGRRIKRMLYIDMTSIRFCDEEMLERFSGIQLISEYIERKKNEVAEYNRRNNIDDSNLVNGRRLTNIGTFRAYVDAYLRNHPRIHQNMTFLVRQMEPTDHGLPIAKYMYSAMTRSGLTTRRYRRIYLTIFLPSCHSLASVFSRLPQVLIFRSSQDKERKFRSR